MDKDGEKPTLSRRQFLLGAGAAAASAFLPTGCAPETIPDREPNLLPKEENLEIPQTIKHWLSDGENMKTPDDIRMLDETFPGIDLTYSGNERVAWIRSISKPVQKMTTAIGFLAVEKSKRYNWKINNERVYTCNVYVLDFLRLVLGDKVIGSRYNLDTEIFSSYGISDLDWSNDEVVEKNFAENPFISSNNLDHLMEEIGRGLGWKLVDNQEELKESLNNGNVCLGATPCKKIQEERAGGGNPTGHAFAVLSLGNYFGITQSTSNILLNPYPFDSLHPKVNPEVGNFRFWTHDV